jgi:hypothetical protein
MSPTTLPYVPDDLPVPTHVLTAAAVRWSIDTLGAQRLHPTFVMYLYLRQMYRAGALYDASASSDELLELIRMPGHPTKPYYFPLIDRGKRTGKPLASFWRSPNIPGSWSPISIQRGAPWLTEDRHYTLPENHVEQAFRHMLYGQQVSALALGAYFLRNDGFVLSGEPSAADVIAGFRDKFDFLSETEDEFSRLFSTDVPKVTFNWFEPVQYGTLLSREPADV